LSTRQLPNSQATAFIEHTLSEELEDCGLAPPRTFAGAIRLAGQRGIFYDELLERTDKLRTIRNPFAHRRDDDDRDGLYSRYRARGIGPTAVLEQDAQRST